MPIIGGGRGTGRVSRQQEQQQQQQQQSVIENRGANNNNNTINNNQFKYKDEISTAAGRKVKRKRKRASSSSSSSKTSSNKKIVGLPEEEEIRSFVKEAHADVMASWYKHQEQLLQYHLKESRDNSLLLSQQQQPKAARRVFKRLKRNDDPTDMFWKRIYCMPCNEDDGQQKQQRSKSTNEGDDPTNNGTINGDSNNHSNTNSEVEPEAVKNNNNTVSNSTSSSTIDDSSMTADDNNNDDDDDDDDDLKKALAKSRREYLNHRKQEQQQQQQKQQNNRTSSSTPSYSVQVRQVSKVRRESVGPPLYLEGQHEKRPYSSSTIFLKTHYATEDEQQLKYVPYFGDDDREDVVSDLYNTKDREFQMEAGAPYKERSTDVILDQIWMLLRERWQYHQHGDSIDFTNPQISEMMCAALTDVMDEYRFRIDQRYAAVILKQQQQKEKESAGVLENSNNSSSDDDNDGKAGKTAAPSFECVVANNTASSTPPTRKLESYLDAMDTYRPLFCRRCFVYDCNMHSNLTKPSLLLQGEMALQKERDGFWNNDPVFWEKYEKEDVAAVVVVAAVAKQEDTVNKNSSSNAESSSSGDDSNSSDDNNEKNHSQLAEKKKASSLKEGDEATMIDKKQDDEKTESETSTTSDDKQQDGNNNSKEEESPSNDNKNATLTTLQKSICERMFLIFQGDIPKMTAAMGAPASEETVAEYCRLKNYQKQPFQVLKEEQINMFKQSNKNRKGGRKGKSYEQSMNNYNPTWLKRVENAEVHPFFQPCEHEQPCSETNCRCVQNAIFCTKHCAWERRSRNFYRGCACAGKCTTKSCSCFAAMRECDPDLCKSCGACTDPPNRPAGSKKGGGGQRCRNDNISMRRHCQLLLGESSIKDAGWGIYNRTALKRGDYIHEYVGEVISQEEAERRGRVYDKVNRSYLFNLSSDFVVDASRKGNKTRFANHSSKPNCYTKMVNVNGDYRIGLFAREDIEPQSELFFDYRYDVNISNELLLKPGLTVDWMKDPQMAHKISKTTSVSFLQAKKKDDADYSDA